MRLGSRNDMCAAAIAVGVVAWAGCGSSFNGHIYRDSRMAFSVGRVPGSWKPIEVTRALLAFRDADADATIAINGRCGEDGDDVPLAALTKHLFLMFTEQQIMNQSVVPMDGREAMRTQLFAKFDGVRKAFVVYVLKKDSCVYDFMYVGAPEGFEHGVGNFDQFVRGFHTMSTESGSG